MTYAPQQTRLTKLDTTSNKATPLPLVTIITPTFNSAATLERTIQSVRNQTYQNLQYIIIDGGSTDDTLDIIRANTDCISEWVSEPDNGIYDAMNKGIARASGDIIGILNSDDTYYPSAISLAAHALTDCNAGLAYGNIHFITRFGDRILHRPKSNITRSDFWTIPMPHAGVFVKKSEYIKHGTFDTRYRIAADYDLIFRFFDAGVNFTHIDEPIAVMYDGGASTRSATGWLEYGDILRKRKNTLSVYIRYTHGFMRHLIAQKVKTNHVLSKVIFQPYRLFRIRSGTYQNTRHQND